MLMKIKNVKTPNFEPQRSIGSRPCSGQSLKIFLYTLSVYQFMRIEYINTLFANKTITIITRTLLEGHKT
jgi:hypothetical protein